VFTKVIREKESLCTPPARERERGREKKREDEDEEMKR